MRTVYAMISYIVRVTCNNKRVVISEPESLADNKVATYVRLVYESYVKGIRVLYLALTRGSEAGLNAT